MSDLLSEGRPPGARRASKSSRRPVRKRPSGGSRARRPVRRRTHGLPGTLGMTLVGGMIPGAGYLYAGRRLLGALILTGWLVVFGAVVWYFGRGVGAALDLAFDPGLLKAAALALALGLLVWAFVVVTTYRMVRPRRRPRVHTVVGNLMVGVVLVTFAAPVVLAARYALVQADLVETVFSDNGDSATVPENATEDDPWAGEGRVNILLLGGDGGEGRTGVRTDTMILASIDTDSGKTVMFSLPRNMMYAEFPEDSPLHDIYPDGYETGQGDPGFDMLNAVYSQVPELHPGVLGKSDNEGADAVKEAVSGSLGLPVDYYLLVNLEGFKEVVDAMGGITVNINEPVAIQGNTDLGIPPDDYLDPGPDQLLDGFEALWFARGRYGSDDYARMDRQRCAVDALIDAADPVNLLTRYIDLAKTGKEIIYTDIPRKLAPSFVELLLEVKGAPVRSVVFRASEKFFSGDPDYDYVRDVVDRAIDPAKRKKGDKPATKTEDPVDACAYAPTDEVVASE